MRTQRQKSLFELGAGGPGRVIWNTSGTGPKSHLSHPGEGPRSPLECHSAQVTGSVASNSLLTPQAVFIRKGRVTRLHR